MAYGIKLYEHRREETSNQQFPYIFFCLKYNIHSCIMYDRGY